MGAEIHKRPELMEVIEIIQEHEEDKYSDIPTWTGWVETWTDSAVLLDLPGRETRSNWFPLSQLRRTEDGKSLYASEWILRQKGW